MLDITQGEALEALQESDPMGLLNYSIVNKTPDRLGKLGVFLVTMWDGDFFEANEVLFERRNGKVKVYSGKA
jgi:hypothetical protein